jgi:hypothetical protein
MPFRYTACGSQTTTSRDPLKYYATAKKNETQFGKGQKNGNLYDEFNCYYISEEEARRSIDWALFILNIIYSNHEKH